MSVCECIEGMEYDHMVDTFPDGNIPEYRYVDDEFIHDPLPKPDPEESDPTAEELINIILGLGRGESNE